MRRLSLFTVLFFSACGPSAPVVHAVSSFPRDDLVVNGKVVLPAHWYDEWLPDRARTRTAHEVLDGYAAQLSELDGLSRVAPLFVRFDADLDPATVPLLSIAELPAGQTEVTWDPALRVARLLPLSVPKGSITVDLSRVRGARGEKVATASGAPLRLTRFGEPTRRLRAVAAVLAGVTPDPDFTDPQGGPDRVFPRGSPGFDALFKDAGVPSAPSCAIAGVGRFPAHDLRDPDTNVWRDDFAADPLSSPAPLVDFRFALPDGPGPHPFAILAHGINGSNVFVHHFAEPFCARGVAVIGISAALQGERGSVVKMFDLGDIRVGREGFRQTAVDLLQLARLSRSAKFDVDGVPGPDLDADRPGFLGNSFGSIMGGVYLSIEPMKMRAVLDVPGSRITRLIEKSGSLHDVFAALAGARLDIPKDATAEALPLLLTVAQSLLDAGDPLSYAGSDAGGPLLAQMGVGDETIPNEVTELLAGCLGLGAPGAGSRVLYPVDPATLAGWSSQDDPHNVMGLSPAVQRQAARWVASGGTDLCDPAAGCN